jgi:diaminopimelate epimerase
MHEFRRFPTMKLLKFTKMSGNGNDFIVIDNYSGKIKLSGKEIEALCTSRFSIGADGLIMLEKCRKPYDFYMRFYNNDGLEAEMCGNGGRCISRFAYLNKRAGAKMMFMAKDGEHEAGIKSNGTVKLKMILPYDLKLNVKVKAAGEKITGTYLNTGVPHFVVSVNDIEKVDVQCLGRALRFHKVFGDKGTNVNFIQKKGGIYAIRTYERGVEAETFACGTGATAAGISLYMNKKAKPPVKFMTKGGLLTIYFDACGCCGISDVWLEGNARVVSEGIVSKEAFRF